MSLLDRLSGRKTNPNGVKTVRATPDGADEPAGDLDGDAIVVAVQAFAFAAHGDEVGGGEAKLVLGDFQSGQVIHAGGSPGPR